MADIQGFQAFVLGCVKKTDLIFEINQTLQVGIINKVYLNVDEDYLPEGSLVGNELLDIYVLYNGVEIQAVYDDNSNDYYFSLDLTSKVDNRPVDIEVIVNEDSLVNPSNLKLSLPCTFATADSFNMLSSQIVAGAEIIQLTDNIIFDSGLLLPHQVYIIGDGFNVDLGSYGFVVNENISAKFKNINFINGSPCFVQRFGSKLVLDNCSFENASITDEYKGSVIYTLNDTNITTELNDCSILNCHHSIYHAGSLTVNNIKAFYNNYNESVDNDYPAFLTSYDGQVNITNSKFDIDYTTEILCTNQIDIKFAQSLIGIGETTVINGYSRNQLQANNSLHLTETPFNNRCHIYCKYYYPSIEACVITSPAQNYEDRAVCHNIIGEDYVYKNNVQVTRAEWQTENNNRTLTWED